MLLVPTLQALLDSAHHNRWQPKMPGPLAQSADCGVCLLFPCGPSAALPFRQYSTPKTHWDMGTILVHLLQDCSHGTIRCFGAEHKSFFGIDKE